MRVAVVLASAVLVLSAIAVSGGLAANGAWTRATNAQTANVLAIAIDPVRPSTLYAATYKDGVYKSTDGGRSWRGAGVGQGVRSLAINPASSSTVYAGTWRRGIYKTTDGAAAWSVLKLPFNDMGVLALAVDPRNPETVYAGTESAGIFKTTDGGVTWMEMNRGIGRRMVLGLAIDPTSPDTAYAATFREGYQEGSGALFLTTNGGGNWSEVMRRPLARGDAIAVDPRRSTTVYAVLDERLVRSTNSGATWTATSPLPQGLARAVTVDPRTSTVYVGMAVDWRTRKPLTNSVYRSTNGGRRWEAFGSGLKSTRRSGAALRSPAVHVLAFPSNGRALFAGTSGGGVFHFRFPR